MMNKRPRTFLLIVAVCWLSQSAPGEIFIVGDNVTDGTLITTGYPINGSFDLTTVLPKGPGYVQPYKVISAYYTFDFQDDYDVYLRYYSDYTDEDWVWYCDDWYLPHYHYYRTVRRSYYDPEEHVQVDIEGQYSTDGGTTYYYTSHGYTSGDCDHWLDYYESTSGYHGSLTLTQYLGPAALASLSNDGVVDFTLTATVGDIRYMSGTLTADVVPVPGAVLLGILGLGAAGLKLRKYA